MQIAPAIVFHPDYRVQLPPGHRFPIGKFGRIRDLLVVPTKRESGDASGNERIAPFGCAYDHKLPALHSNVNSSLVLLTRFI